MALTINLRILEVDDKTEELSRAFVKNGVVPVKQVVDALHIAVAAVHEIDYLLTWSCKHIANAQRRAALTAICSSAGFRCPVICTPEELPGKQL